MEQVENVYSVGHELKDVKVSFNRDIKFELAGIKVDGKQGEILNIPRWIGNVLEQEGHAEIQENDMIVALKQSIVKENVQGEDDLSTLDPDFYIKLKSQMKKLPPEDFDKVESMLNSLVRKRQGKIVRLADSMKLSSDISKKLSIEEKNFYNNIHEQSSNFKKLVLNESP